MTRRSLFAAALVALSTTACFTTKVTSGRPAQPPTIAYDERWHHGVVAGLGELSGPYDLSAICPNGWAEIETETTFPNFVAELFTAGGYAPQTITVRCAAGAPPGAPPQTPVPPLPPPPPTPAAPPAPSATPGPAMR